MQVDICFSIKHSKIGKYAKSGKFPSLRAISKRSGVNTKEIYQLFPKGPARKIARTSGFGKPKGCI